MIARLTHMFTTFVTARFEGVISSSILSIVENFVNRGRQALLLIIASFVFSVLFAAGVIISILEASSQFDTKGFIYFSAMLSSSTALSGLSLIALVALFWPRGISTTIMTRPQIPVQPVNTHTTLEDILAVVVSEGVQYLKDKKVEHAAERSASPHSKPHPHMAN